MFKPHEIFALMPADAAAGLLGFVLEREKPLYKATIDTLAKQRKLRPVFVERKPRVERQAWLKEALGRKVNEGVAAHLLQIWLIGAHKDVLCDFLDALGVKHDENGTIDNLPEAPSKEALLPAIDILLSKHERSIVAIYLHAFQALDEKGWPTLEEILHEDERLKLDPSAAAPVAPAESAAPAAGVTP
jgi:hypothetical protein